MERPGRDEYAAFYARYIDALPEDDLDRRLSSQATALRAACAELSEEAALHRYDSGKWSIKEVIGHMTDAERVFFYRLLCISRGETRPLPGFDENAYVQAGGFDDNPLEYLLDEFSAARAATLSLLRCLPEAALTRRGNANGSEITVRALIYIIAAHVHHHFRLLHDRYGLPLDL